MMKVISFLVALVTMLMTTTVQSKILIKIDLDSQRLSATKASDGVVAALPDGIKMCQVCECQSSQSGKGGNHG